MINSLIEYFYKGGWIMWPILLLGILSLAVFLEKIIYLGITRISKKKLLEILKNTTSDYNLSFIDSKFFKNESLQLLQFYYDLLNANFSANLIQKKGDELIKNLNRRVFILSLNSQISPLLGLLGTVLGMIDAFQSIANLQTQPAPSLVAGGIWVAMITTAFGLIVSIPSYVFYVILEKLIENRIDLLNMTANFLESRKLPNEVFLSKTKK